MVALGLMIVLAGDMRAVFAWAIVPAMIAVLLIVVGVEEPRGIARSAKTGPPIRLADVRGMGRRFWSIVLLGVVFTLARFSEAFLILRAQGVGLPIALVPLVLVIMNIVYAAVAAPVGALSDRIGRRKLLGAGLLVLLAADIVLALSGNVAGVLVGVALWGLHLGLTQGLLSTLVADAAPASLRATAFGLFNLATDCPSLAASLIITDCP